MCNFASARAWVWICDIDIKHSFSWLNSPHHEFARVKWKVFQQGSSENHQWSTVTIPKNESKHLERYVNEPTSKVFDLRETMHWNADRFFTLDRLVTLHSNQSTDVIHFMRLWIILPWSLYFTPEKAVVMHVFPPCSCGKSLVLTVVHIFVKPSTTNHTHYFPLLKVSQPFKYESKNDVLNFWPLNIVQ